jgi:hypothetical protein
MFWLAAYFHCRKWRNVIIIIAELQPWRELGFTLLFIAILHLSFSAVALPAAFVLLMADYVGSILQVVAVTWYWLVVVMVAASGKVSGRALLAIVYAWRKSTSRSLPANDSGLMWWCFHLLTGGWLRGEILLQPCLLTLLLLPIVALLAFLLGPLVSVVCAAAYLMQPLIAELVKGSCAPLAYVKTMKGSRVGVGASDHNLTSERGQLRICKVRKCLDLSAQESTL